MQLHMDYWQLNKLTIKNKDLLLHIDDRSDQQEHRSFQRLICS